MRVFVQLSLNLLAHIAVARRHSNEPAFWLGAALPDLQREAGVVLGELAAWPPAIQAGIGCHRVADAAFHDLPVFLGQSRALTRGLLEVGVPRGAARAVGHAGWELLFDGALVADAGVVDAYLAAMAVEVDDVAFAAVLARRRDYGAPTLYAEPAEVAELLWRVLGRRRLLAFDRAYLAPITAALTEAQPTITASVGDVFAALG